MLPENKPNHIVLNKLVIITTKKHNDYIDIMSMWANNRILLKQCAQYNNGIITPIVKGRSVSRSFVANMCKGIRNG